MHRLSWLLDKFKLTSKAPYLLIILTVFLIILATNFPFSSWYTGWDNLHPEFNFALNIKRALTATWQENEGLGLLGGHGFAATLPHTLFLLLLSIFIPINHLRAVFTFLMLLIGSIGAFYLTSELLKGKKEPLKYFASLNASLLYMLNLATIQNFFIQLEAFIIHFAALPWLLYSLLLLLEKRTKERLLFFIIINFLSTPQGFIPPLFIVYTLSLGIILLFYTFEHFSIQKLKTSVTIGLLTIFINAYWLFPLIYYTFAKSSIYLNSYNNLSSTEDFILKNAKYGDIQNVALLKGFLIEAIDTVQSGKIFYIFEAWNQHLTNPLVLITGYLIFSVILLGLFYYLKTNKTFLKLALLVIFILSFSALATNTFPFSTLSNLLQQVPLFKQAFRAAFTKFSINLSLFYSLFYGMGVFWIISFFASKLYHHKTRIQRLSEITTGFSAVLLPCFLILFSMPIFQGNFLYNRTKINIPDSYFQLFDYLKSQDPNTRIMNLPQGWNWGWSLYKWGYSGSGFLWYGIQQPILDRAFDVWSSQNENYFWELSRALYSGDTNSFDKLLEKYQITWILFDENLIPYPNIKNNVYTDKIKKYLDSTPKFTLVKTFTSNDNSDPLQLYKINLNHQPKSFLSLRENLTMVEPSYTWNNNDVAFSENGYYQSSKTTPANSDIFYPYRSLFTGRSQQDIEVKIDDQNNYVSFITKIPQNLSGESLEIPTINENEVLNYNKTDFQKPNLTLPQILIDGVSVNYTAVIRNQKLENPKIASNLHLPELQTGNLEIKIPKLNGFYSYDSSSDPEFQNQTPKACNQFLNGFYTAEKLEEGLRLTSINSSNCLDIELPYLSQNNGYLMIIKSQHIEGKALNVALINKSSQRSDFESILPKNTSTNLSYFIITPMEQYGSGYGIHIDNSSIGSEKTINDLSQIQVIPIPYSFLTSLKITKSIPINTNDLTHLLVVNHNDATYYEAGIENTTNNTGDSTLILSQSYDDQWKLFSIKDNFLLHTPLKYLAVALLGKEQKTHVIVNNWENGWVINNQTSSNSNKLIILYLPQIIQQIGFLMLISVFVIYCLQLSFLWKKQNK